MIRNVHLIGALADKFGAGPYRFKADNLRELLAALTAIHPTFRRELLNHKDLAVLKKRGDEVAYLKEEELAFQFGNWPDLYLAVGEAGSAEGAAAIASYFAQAGTAAYYAIYAISYIAITVAISYGVSAVIQSLADVPDVKEGRRADNRSTLFNGPDNRETQGGRVQLVYGRFRVGSYTLSQSIEARRQPIGLDDSISVNEGTTGSINIFANDIQTSAPTVVNWSTPGSGTLSPGASYTESSVEITVQSDGTVLVNAPAATGGTQFSVTVNCDDEGDSFTNVVGVSITTDYSYYNYGGGDSGGDGGPG